jgi:hypothetical protein
MIEEENARLHADTLVEQSTSRARCNAQAAALSIWKYKTADNPIVLADTDEEVEALLTKWKAAVATWADAKLPMDLQFEKTPPPLPADLAKYKPVGGVSSSVSDELREYHAKETLKAAIVRKQVQATLRRLDRGESVGDVARVLTEQLAGIKTAAEDKPVELFKLVDADELFTTEYKIEWLVKGLLVKGQPGLICGPKKALKTTLAEEIAVSLASGTDVLGNPKWRVSERQRVLFFSAESGDATIAETSKRIAATKGFDHAIGPSTGFSDDPPEAGLKGWLFHCWGVPALNDEAHIEELRRVIRKSGANVVILDPAYLMFAGADPKSIFDMGPRLRILNEICNEMMATILLIHHFKKGRSEADSPQLEDIAFAGFQEWCRQWLLIDREGEYVPGSGHHELVMSWGGSVGHSGQVTLAIDEGVHDGWSSQRTWQVEVVDRQAKQVRQAENKSKAEQKALDDATEAINAAFRSAGGKDLTLPDLARAAGMDQRNKAFLKALGAMIRSKRIEEVEFKKGNKQTYEGFRRNWKEGEEQAA